MEPLYFYTLMGCIGLLLFLPIVVIVRILKCALKYNSLRKGVAHIPRFPKLVGSVSLRLTDPRDIAPLLTNPETGHFHDIVNVGPDANGVPLLLISDPEMAKQILSGNHVNEFPKLPATYDVVQEGLLGNGLVTAKGDVWKTHRHLLTPLFHLKTLKEMQQMMVVYTNDLLQSLEAKKGQWLPSLETFGSFTLSQIIMLAFGGLISVEWMVKKQMELGHVFVSYLSGLIVYGPIYKYLPLPSVRNMFSIRKDVAEQTKSVIQQVREEVTRKIAAGEDHIIATNLLTTMITAKDASGRSFSDQDIIDEATTMLFAGFDTTAVTLSWALHYISRDKERQEKLRNEICSVLGDRDPTLGDLSKLKYLKQVINETLRLHPAGAIIDRVCAHDTYLGPNKVFVPAGTSIAIGIQYIHRNGKVWANPHEYNPERWVNDESDGAANGATSGDRHPYSFIPFSAGSRNCIGKAFATQELSVALSMLIRKFDIICDYDRPVKESYSPVPSPGNLYLKFIPRY